MNATTLVLLTAAEAQRYLAVPAGTVYSWASRGVLRALDRDELGRPRYEASTLLQLRGEPA